MNLLEKAGFAPLDLSAPAPGRAGGLRLLPARRAFGAPPRRMRTKLREAV